MRREDGHHGPVPHEGPHKGYKQSRHDLHPKALWDDLQIQQIVEIREGSPGAAGHEGYAGEEREEQRLVFQHAFHPRAALVVDKYHRHLLGRLDQPAAGVEKVALEGHRHEPCPVVECLLVHAVDVLCALLLKLNDLFHGLGAHGFLRQAGDVHHAAEVDCELPKHAKQDRGVKHRGERPNRVHPIHRPREGEGQGGHGHERAASHHLRLGRPGAVHRHGGHCVR
mmetsp:Transcript_33368/g.72935  ORF Transcript_33368/g.72935 Transcript_33368/m.72935 type:complete len:225 (+) Transcript_33368:308-982(+)